MGNLNFPHFAHFAITKCGKCAKFTFRELQKSVFWFFCTFCHTKSPKRCKIHTPRNLNFQHFQHNRKFLNPKMSIMSIVHTSKIESVTMCVDGDGLFETLRISSRPSRIVTGNMYAVSVAPYKAENDVNPLKRKRALPEM